MKCPFCGGPLKAYKPRMTEMKWLKWRGGCLIVCHNCLIKWYSHSARKNRIDMTGWVEI